MLTTVVIPTHNRAEMAREAIESALALEDPSAREVLVVDDGSTDGTDSVLREFGSKIRTIRTDRGERSKARNLGVREARGQWVHFLDDDDLLLPGGLPALEAAVQSGSPDVHVWYGRTRFVKSDPSNPLLPECGTGVGVEGWVLEELLGMNFISMGSVLAEKSRLMAVGLFDETRKYCEDWDLWLRVAAGSRFGFVDREVVAVRLHETNTMRAVETAGRETERVREQHLLGQACMDYARARRIEGRDEPAARLAWLCSDLARRRWWEGEWATSRQALRQAVRLAGLAGLRGMGPAWRAFLPARSSGSRG